MPIDMIFSSGVITKMVQNQEFTGDGYGVLTRWKWFGSSSLGGASHTGMMKCVMSPVSFNGPLTEDIPMGVVEE
ncbi:hypothetical protein HGM15179_011860 [Zosterops borbonicus]|uniref:Uncharacterized protein n=1 Tax=Zosterops borbonicus TaxID=364589 RepID=A0A8K1GBU9_9PASS|nr:hypothetical protein HGM15179_011860 [Zosterops borbonicus]